MLLPYIILITLPYLFPVLLIFLVITLIICEHRSVYIFRLIKYTRKYLSLFLYLILISYSSDGQYHNNNELNRKNLYIPIILKKIINQNLVYSINIYYIVINIALYIITTFILNLSHLMIVENLSIFTKNEITLNKILHYLKNKCFWKAYKTRSQQICLSISYNISKRFSNETFNLYLAMKLKKKVEKFQWLNYFKYFSNRSINYTIHDRYLISLLLWLRYK
uniref:Uncharacterized protein n=1 Tax=Polysiphonia sertularioides TaxID=945028 RepID=A0A1Z1M9A1_9FLOR|nr:hypothetical protein [Polysiphonia sertularioides]ARW62473.1 hypothetical protein [Polysiphonia sertularioides]